MFLSIANDFLSLVNDIDRSFLVGAGAAGLFTYFAFNTAQVATVLRLSSNLPFSKLKKGLLSAIVFIPIVGLWISLSVIATAKGRHLKEKTKAPSEKIATNKEQAITEE
jgi:hypothetical protein